MVAADGYIDDDEIAIIRRIDGPSETPDWNSAVKVWQKNSVESCAEYVVQFLGKQHKQTLFANLVDIAMADGELAGQEKALLEFYVKALNPDESFIAKIVEVTEVKNNIAER